MAPGRSQTYMLPGSKFANYLRFHAAINIPYDRQGRDFRTDSPWNS